MDKTVGYDCEEYIVCETCATKEEKEQSVPIPVSEAGNEYCDICLFALVEQEPIIPDTF